MDVLNACHSETQSMFMLSLTLWELKHVRDNAKHFTVRSHLGGFQATYSRCTLDMSIQCCGSEGVSRVYISFLTITSDKYGSIAELCYLCSFVAYCMLKYSKGSLHSSLCIIPKHLERVFFVTSFISIQNPAMNKMINIKISSSSQWDWLSGTFVSCAVTPGDEKRKCIHSIYLFDIINNIVFYVNQHTLKQHTYNTT